MKPNISVIIPSKDDHHLLPRAVGRLFMGLSNGDVEVIIVDDGSISPLGDEVFNNNPNVSVHRLPTRRGVGYAFDYGVKKARADVIMLMGADVLVKDPEWMDRAMANAINYPMSITCSVCVGLKEEDLYYWDDKTRRYGATILFGLTRKDLPEDSQLALRDNYTDILQCRWIRRQKEDVSYEIPSVLGACYVVTKRWYEHIGGWGYIKSLKGLTKEETKWSGFRIWGGLEPMISLKSWFAGGSCRVDPQWETGHIFGRMDHVSKVRGTRMDMYYFNKLFMAHTLFSPRDAVKLDRHLPKIKNVNQARSMIRRNRNAIALERLYNDSIKKDYYEALRDRAGCSINFFK
jgi:glycosyltransferase involved in cell wall biosynthesis